VEPRREPNHLLAAVMDKAGVSNKGLASRVRAEAERAGLAIRSDHVAVRRWLDGTVPREDTIRCITAALSRKLGRRVSRAEVGFGTPGTPDDSLIVEDGTQFPENSSKAVELLDHLTTADLGDSSEVMNSNWIEEAAPGVITGYLFAGPIWSPAAEAPSVDTPNLASRIRATVRSLTDLDFQFGGGHVRKMILSYWKSEIVPALRGNHPEPLRRELFAAAADAAEVLGWSAYDAGRHGAAQRYFVQGLRLAKEADDPVMGGQILSNLSHQANYLGNFSQALQFARAAQSAAAGKATATVQSMFLAMEARALASLGDGKGCLAALTRAEQAFEKRLPSSDPDWISYFDEFELAGEASHCFRDLGHAREILAFSQQAIDPERTPPRTRSFITMVNAAGALHAGNLDEAIHLATESVRLAGSLQSDRYVRYLSDFHLTLANGHATNRTVQEFKELLKASHPAALRSDAA
jgi:tetratricopeptide (TPR) repeat protein